MEERLEAGKQLILREDEGSGGNSDGLRSARAHPQTHDSETLAGYRRPHEEPTGGGRGDARQTPADRTRQSAFAEPGVILLVRTVRGPA